MQIKKKIKKIQILRLRRLETIMMTEETLFKVGKIGGNVGDLVDICFEKLYNAIFEENKDQIMRGYDQFNEAIQLSKVQANEIYKTYLNEIKMTIKGKIKIYDPLTFKTTYKGFLEWLKEDELKVIREFPGDSSFEDYLYDLVRQYLVEKTYYHLLFEDRGLVENYVRKIVTKYSIPWEFVEEIAIFVRERLETRKRLAAFKKNFDEQSRLKTYFFSAICNLVKDYQEKYSDLKKVELKEDIDIDKFPTTNTSPFTESEARQIKARVEELDNKEKLVFKLFYYDGITNINALGRTIGTSRYKAKRILDNSTRKILTANVKKNKEGRKR
jgi:RNA polymerase sigma factor (sigma-70 family)